MRRGSSYAGPWLLAALALPLLPAAPGCASEPRPRMRTTDGVELYVRDVGVGESVLVVPGASWVEHDLDPLLTGRRVVFYDARGRGRSSEVRDAETSLERDVEDLEELRAALGIERMSLFGWAYRGGVAVRYALALPGRVERLVLVAPLAPRREPHWSTYIEALRSGTDPAVLAQLDALRQSGRKDRDPYGYCREVTAAFLRTALYDPAAIERMRSDPCALPNLDPDEVARQGQASLARLGDWDWRSELAALELPVLILHGRADPTPLAGSEEYALHLPAATLLVIDEAGHLPWLERPEMFFPPVVEFLSESDS